ncbi:MAG: tetratricopeptide repeat protein [Terriglobia bacterium]
MKTIGNISLCMIVKNETGYLEKALSSASPSLEELIVVDTGSQDDTPEIASRFGAKVFPYPWKDDFSSARNFSIAQATRPWILVMDADEALSPTDLEKLGILTEREDPVAYSLIQRNYLNTSGKLSWDQTWKRNLHDYDEGREFAGYLDIPVVRMFPRRREIRYSGCVHESVEDSLAKAGIPIEGSGVVLHHYGQVRSPNQMKKKKNLYLRLGLEKLELNPLDPRTHFELGIQYQELGYYAEAIPHFEKAIRHGIDCGLAELYLGICTSRLGRFSEARRHLLRSRESRPDSAELHCELGIISLKENQPEVAKSYFTKAITLSPDHVASLCYLGAILINQEKWSEGTRLLKQALELDPNHQDSWVNLGIAYQRVEKYSEALECQRKAYSLTPNQPELARQLGLGLARSGKYAEAAEVLGRFIQTHSAEDTLKMIWAMTLVRSGQRTEALQVYREVTEHEGRLATIAREQLQKLTDSYPAAEKPLHSVD